MPLPCHACRWTGASNDEKYAHGLALLQDFEVDRCQLRVQSLVLEIKQVRVEREHVGTASKETARLRGVRDRKVAKLKEVLQELSAWRCINTSQTADQMAYAKEQVDAMYKGTFPWRDADAGVAAALAVHHGRLYHSSRSNVDRTVEEEALIQVEKLQLMNWVVVSQGRVHDALVSVGLHSHVDSSSASSYEESGPLHGHTHDTVDHGKAHMLSVWQRKLAQMHASAVILLKDIPAPVSTS